MNNQCEWCGAYYWNDECILRKKNNKRIYTTFTADSYPRYRRRSTENGGIRSNQIDNRWVVPYNPYLLKKYNAHINVEICSSILSVRYLYKYVYKGHDRVLCSIDIILSNDNDNNNNTYRFSNNFTTTNSTTVNTTTTTINSTTTNANSTTTTTNSTTTNTNTNSTTANTTTTNSHSTSSININEIQEYVNARYVAASEAMWRLLSFPLNKLYPIVIRLQIHLPDLQMVTFRPGEERITLLNGVQTKTMLTAYFDMVANERLHPPTSNYLGFFDDQLNPDAAHITYQNFPQYYTYQISQRQWKRRTRPHKQNVVGRIYTAYPSGQQKDKYYLRILLCNVCGCGSFQELLTYNGTIFDSFHDVCVARGLVQAENEWKNCLIEVSIAKTGQPLRHLFSIIII